MAGPPRSAASAAAPRGGGGARAWLSAPGLRDAVAVTVGSRLVVWAAGVIAYLGFALSPLRRYDHGEFTESFGDVGNALAAPAVRWDSVWYVDLATHGYRREHVEPAFFPFYSLVMRGVSEVLRSEVVAGLVISLAAFVAALVLLWRLCELELGPDVARRTLALVAFFPAALFFSAVYTESLFLALEVGSFYAARRGRWAWAGVLGALGAATRNTGVLLVPALAVLYLYGPRDDRPPDRPQGRRLRPRYRLRADALWIAAVPLGLAAYLVYMQAHFGDWQAPLNAQEHFRRSFEGPLSALWLGAEKAWDQVTDWLRDGDNLGQAARSLGQLGVACGAVVATVGVLRRLPAAYGVYAAVTVVSILSFPYSLGPLASVIRYVVVVFPLFMWLALVLRDRRAYVLTVVAFAAMLVYATGRFATWYFVA